VWLTDKAQVAFDWLSIESRTPPQLAWHLDLVGREKAQSESRFGHHPLGGRAKFFQNQFRAAMIAEASHQKLPEP